MAEIALHEVIDIVHELLRKRAVQPQRGADTGDRGRVRGRPGENAAGSPGSACEMKKVRTTTPTRLGMVPKQTFPNESSSAVRLLLFAGATALPERISGSGPSRHRTQPGAIGMHHIHVWIVSKRYASLVFGAVKCRERWRLSVLRNRRFMIGTAHSSK